MNRVEGVRGQVVRPVEFGWVCCNDILFPASCCSGELISFRPREFSAGMPEVGKPVMFLLSSGLSCVWLLGLFLLDRLVTERIQNPWERMERVIQKL